MPAELATYRLQMCCGFTLDDAAAIAEYLAQLGVSHVYSSPLSLFIVILPFNISFSY